MWKQGVIWPLMRSVDDSLQFGDSSACNRFNRLTSSGVEESRLLVAQLDILFPTRDPRIERWFEARRSHTAPESSAMETMMSFIMAFFDDVSGAGFDDPIYPQGSDHPVMRPPRPPETEWSTLTRQWMTFEAVRTFFELSKPPPQLPAE